MSVLQQQQQQQEDHPLREGRRQTTTKAAAAVRSTKCGFGVDKANKRDVGGATCCRGKKQTRQREAGANLMRTELMSSLSLHYRTFSLVLQRHTFVKRV